MIKKINLIIIIFGLLFVSSLVSANNCELSIVSNQSNLEISHYIIGNNGLYCKDNSCYFTFAQDSSGDTIIIDSTDYTNLYFKKSNCDNKKIILRLTKNFEININNNNKINRIFNFDNDNPVVDIFDLNGFDFNIIVSNNSAEEGKNKYKINTLLKSSYNGSKLNMIGPVRGVKCYHDAGLMNNSIILTLKNIEVSLGASLNINLIAQKPTKKCYEGITGTNVILEGDEILNNGNLNILLRGGDSGMGSHPAQNCNHCLDSGGSGAADGCCDGGNARIAGLAKLSLDKIDNYNNFNIDINSGNGGTGGKGCDRGSNSPCVDSHCFTHRKAGDGGNGGKSNNVYFDVSNINNNSDANLNINLVGGNGGDGGDSGKDSGTHKEDTIIGNAGSGGYITIDPLYSISNDGNFNLNIIAGNGGKGGNKSTEDNPTHCSFGNGGNAGGVSDINIGLLKNTSDNFNINIIDGLYGSKGNCENNNFPAVNGNYSLPGNLIIESLYNTKDAVDINLITHRPDVNVEKNTSDIFIKNVQSGSYLPHFLNTLNSGGFVFTSDDCINNCENEFCRWEEHCDDYGERCDPKLVCDEGYDACEVDCQNNAIYYDVKNRAIDINACYVNKPSDKLNYITDNLKINATNNFDLDSIVDKTNVHSPLYQYRYCPYCDIIPLDNTIYRIPYDYYLYSDLNGSINTGDLNIYYMTQTTPITIFNLIDPLDVTKNIPLYKNNKKITGVYNNKVGLYEYKINKEILDYYMRYYDPTIVLDNSTNNLFCAAQNYEIKGKITSTNGSTNDFNFKFLPIFKVW